MRAILTYHSIDESGSVISVDPASFNDHIESLAKSGVSVVSLTRLMELPDDVHAVALTFDDGFLNFEQIAWPSLRDHGYPATVFVVTEHVGRTNAWSDRGMPVPQIALLNWAQLEQLAADGVMLGSHTRTHTDLRFVSASQLSDEIEGAAHTIAQRTGTQPTTFAYPYGGFNAEVARAVAGAHAIACTTELRAISASDDTHQLPRLDAYYFRRTSMLARYGSSEFRRYVWLRARGRRLRQVLAGGTR